MNALGLVAPALRQGMLDQLGTPLVVVAIVLFFLSLFVFIARNWLKAGPNEALVLYGRRTTAVRGGQEVAVGYRLIAGGAAFRIPVLESFKRISLEAFQVRMTVEKAPNKDGVPITVDAIANVKIGSDENLLAAAVERFLDKDEEDRMRMIHETLEGQLRQIIGTLTIEEIISEREAISQRVVEHASKELAHIGVVVDNFVFKHVHDEVGYIEALGKRRTAEVKRDATMGAAEADKEAVIRSSQARREGEQQKLDNEAKIAEAQRDLEVKRANYDSEVKAAQARAALAGEIATAEREKELTQRKVAVEQMAVEAGTLVAEKEASLRERKLIAEKIRPAEAERQAAVIRAEGERNAAMIAAEGKAKAAVTIAEGDATAVKARADAEKVRLSAEGEGHAAAEAAVRKQTGLASAEATKAMLLAEADGIKAKGEAEGAAVRAKVTAEAEGLDRKNKALSNMSPAARTVIIMELLPGLFEEGGEALAKALAPAFQSVGAGLAAVDKIQLIDFGGNSRTGAGSNVVERFALSVPTVVFEVLQRAKAMGLDLEKILAKMGIHEAKGDGGAGSSASE